MSLLNKLDLAMKAETLFSEIYGYLAKEFQEDEKIRALFSQLQREEVQHGLRIGMLRKRYLTPRQDTKGIDFDVSQLQSFLGDCESLRDRLAAGESVGSLSEVVLMMAHLEKLFAHAHADMIVGTADPNLRKFFETLAEDDKAHVSMIRGNPGT